MKGRDTMNRLNNADNNCCSDLFYDRSISSCLFR